MESPAGTITDIVVAVPSKICSNSASAPFTMTANTPLAASMEPSIVMVNVAASSDCTSRIIISSSSSTTVEVTVAPSYVRPSKAEAPPNRYVIPTTASAHMPERRRTLITHPYRPLN